MVQHPKWVHSFDLRVWSLLPVQPPEVNTLVFQGVVQLLEVLGKEGLVRAFKWDRLLLLARKIIAETCTRLTTPFEESRPRDLHMSLYVFSKARTPSAGCVLRDDLS